MKYILLVLLLSSCMDHVPKMTNTVEGAGITSGMRLMERVQLKSFTALYKLYDSSAHNYIYIITDPQGVGVAVINR